MSLDQVQHESLNSSFDSESSHERIKSLRRVSRFLERMEIGRVPSFDEGKICHQAVKCVGNDVPREKPSINIPVRNNVQSTTSPIKTSASIINEPQENHGSVCSDELRPPSPDDSACLVEGRNGLVETKKSPMRPKVKQDKRSQRRKNKNFQRFVAAKQLQRSALHSPIASTSNEHDAATGTTGSAPKETPKDMPASNTNRDDIRSLSTHQGILPIRHEESPPSFNQNFHTLFESSYGSVSSNKSPTSVVEIFADGKADHPKQAFNFIRVEAINTKGIMKRRKRRSGKKPKKNLTWWDDGVNAHKPFLLKTDEKSHLYPETTNNMSKCNSLEMLDVLEYYGETLRKSVSGLLFDEEYVDTNNNEVVYSDEHTLDSETRPVEEVTYSDSTSSMLQFVRSIMLPVLESDEGK